MANLITLRGFVCSPVETRIMANGLVVGNFRMGSNIRKLDPGSGLWVDGPTNWFRVNMFRSLATNAVLSISKGDRILVSGKLKITNFTRKNGNPGMGVEIDADSIGLDLQFGTATYHRGTGVRLAGQGNSPADGGPAAEGGTPLSLVSDNSEPPDFARESEGESSDGQDEASRDDDGQEADGDELGDGEAVDTETGEIASSTAVF